ncbi:hypothetical protein LINGRAHAP2_LOCUS32622 [Linum grandiflorum]
MLQSFAGVTVDAERGHRSFAEVVRPLSLSEEGRCRVEERGGRKLVCVEDVRVQASKSYLGCCLVVRLVGDVMSEADWRLFESWTQRWWGVKVEGRSRMADELWLLKFSNKRDVERVRRLGRWVFRGRRIEADGWLPFAGRSSVATERGVVWLRFDGIPVHLRSTSLFKELGEFCGRFEEFSDVGCSLNSVQVKVKQVGPIPAEIPLFFKDSCFAIQVEVMAGRSKSVVFVQTDSLPGGSMKVGRVEEDPSRVASNAQRSGGRRERSDGTKGVGQTGQEGKVEGSKLDVGVMGGEGDLSSNVERDRDVGRVHGSGNVRLVEEKGCSVGTIVASKVDKVLMILKKGVGEESRVLIKEDGGVSPCTVRHECEGEGEFWRGLDIGPGPVMPKGFSHTRPSQVGLHEVPDAFDEERFFCELGRCMVADSSDETEDEDFAGHLSDDSCGEEGLEEADGSENGGSLERGCRGSEDEVEEGEVEVIEQSLRIANQLQMAMGGSREDAEQVIRQVAAEVFDKRKKAVASSKRDRELRRIQIDGVIADTEGRRQSRVRGSALSSQLSHEF